LVPHNYKSQQGEKVKRKFLLACALACSVGLAGTHSAYASCGSAFCALNTHWESQGVWTEPGLRLDLRYEYLKQDQLRAGRHKTQPAGIPDTHDEIQTFNRNLFLGLDYTFDQHWGGSLQLPWISRQHVHVHNDTPPETETWKFDTLGDARVIGRYQFSPDADNHATWGVTAGLKLPTGEFDKTNVEGTLAERTLQPGSGTTDLLLGLYTNSLMLIGDRPARKFLQAHVQYPANARNGFRPGNIYGLDTGVTYQMLSAWYGMLQLNGQIKDRDRGPAAEPAESGGSFVWLSPGLSYAATRRVRAYGFVQLPFYQRVNGMQLTASWTASLGVTTSF
jgi:hypothetical protein